MNKPSPAPDHEVAEGGTVVEIRKIGDSLGLILPEELLAQLKLHEGDKVTVVEQPRGGIKLTRHDELHARTMELARKAMKQYAGALRELAK